MKFLREFRPTLAVWIIGAALLGAFASYELSQLLIKPYEPIGYTSVGTIQDLVPGVEGNAVFEGTAIHYNSQLCVNKEEPVNALVTVYWRQFEPELRNLKDPNFTEFYVTIQPGCNRQLNSSFPLPDFVTPGEWAMEADIKVKGGNNQAQVTHFATTRFKVLAKCEDCTPSYTPLPGGATTGSP
jgi:hypothetical protein